MRKKPRFKVNKKKEKKKPRIKIVKALESPEELPEVEEPEADPGKHYEASGKAFNVIFCKGCQRPLTPYNREGPWSGLRGVFRCRVCGCLQGSVTRIGSYKAVLPISAQMRITQKESPPPDKWRRFHLEINDEEDSPIWEGWYDVSDSVEFKEESATQKEVVALL